MLELLRRVASVKFTPIGRKPKPKAETEYLLSNPDNAKALLEAIERIRNGQVVEHDLIEP